MAKDISGKRFVSPTLTSMGASNGLSHNKDPRGLVQADLVVLRQMFKEKPTRPGRTIEEIMYEAGQQSVLEYIEQNIAPRYSK